MDAQAILGFMVGAVGAVVWSVRIEGQVKAVRAETDLLRGRLDKVEDRASALSSKVADELGKIRESLARIEGRLRD